MCAPWKIIQSEEYKEKANHLTPPTFNPIPSGVSGVKGVYMFPHFYFAHKYRQRVSYF